MDLPDRLAKSLRLSGRSVQDMATFLEVHRNTVGSWLSGRARPNPATLKLWATETKVPYLWLRDGKLPDGSSKRSKK